MQSFAQTGKAANLIIVPPRPVDRAIQISGTMSLEGVGRAEEHALEQKRVQDAVTKLEKCFSTSDVSEQL